MLPASPMRTDVIPPQVHDLCRALRDGGHEAFVVGGCVRDLVRDDHLRIKDWDVTTSASPHEVVRIFGKRAIPTGLAHGTVTVLCGHGDARMPIEVTTYRGEGAYSDGRRPDAVTFVRTLEEDLARRDFTMNALALDPTTAELRDVYGGVADIERRTIRAVGEARARFGEDGLRALRAVRFAAQLEFSVDPGTLAAIPETLDVFAKVSMERVRDEMMKILAARQPSRGLSLMADTGLLARAVPELAESFGVTQNRHHAFDVWSHTLATVDACRNDPIVRWAALLHDVAKPRTRAAKDGEPGEYTFFRHDLVGADMAEAILKRLRFPNREREEIVGLVRNHMFWYSPEWTDATVRRFLVRIGPEAFEPLVELRVGDVVGRGRGEDPETEIGELRRRVAETLAKAQALKVSDLAIGGRDLIGELGLRPGPLLGEILRALLERVIEDPALNEREALLALARAHAATGAPTDG